MVKINEPIVNHFSHPHPLQLLSNSNFLPQNLTQTSCSACKFKASGLIYSCINCSFFLHISCSQMPPQITHPFHQNHVLSLLPKPIYPEGIFNCDACGNSGNGFSYHCQLCNIDLHTACASMPLVLDLAHQTHHHHQLNLTFSPPYHNQSFSCDVCGRLGSGHWLYRCNFCEFDAHLGCAMGNSRPPIQQTQILGNQFPRTAPQYQVLGNQFASAAPRYMAVGRNRQPYDLINQAVQQLVSGARLPLVQGLLDGGGGSAVDGGGGGFFSGISDNFNGADAGSGDVQDCSFLVQDCSF